MWLKFIVNSSNDVACNLLELKTTMPVLPGCCRGGTTAALTEVSAVGACVLPFCWMLPLLLRAARQASQQALSTTNTFVSWNIFSDSLLGFCHNVQGAVMIWVTFF